MTASHLFAVLAGGGLVAVVGFRWLDRWPTGSDPVPAARVVAGDVHVAGANAADWEPLPTQQQTLFARAVAREAVPR